MRGRKQTFLVLAIFASVATVKPVNAAPAETGWSKITTLTGGWTDSWLTIELAIGDFNPDGCPWGWYTIDPSTPGAQLFQSLAISSLMAGKEVKLVIDGCAANRPKVISISTR